MPNIANTSTDDTPEKNSRGRIQTIKKAEFIWPVKYKNTLPDIPFDPKHLRYPFDKTRFVKYTQTSLEKQFNHDLLTESDLGIKIDLVDADLNEHFEENTVHLDEDDEKLLEDDLSVQKHTKRSQCHNRQIAWLKKTEYISTDFNRYGAKNEIDKAEVKVGYGIKKNLKEDIVFLDRDEQIKAIDRTFEAAKKPILCHPKKKGLTPVEVLPVYPDFDNWKIPFAQVMFDADPEKNAINPEIQEQQMSKALIRGIMDESGEQFVAYFMPTKTTLDKLKMDALDHKNEITEEEFEFHMTREYCWDVLNKATKGYEENYFFVWKDDMVCYNELETRVKLTKRRNKSKKPTNSKLFVRHRFLNEQELAVERNRMTLLERPVEEEEPEEEEEAEQQGGQNGNNDETAVHDDEAMDVDEDEDGKEKTEGRKSAESSEDEEDEGQQKKNNNQRRNSRKSTDKDSDAESSSSSSSSGSGSNDEEDNDGEKKKNVKEIFGSESGSGSGSGSDSDSDSD